MKAFLIRSGIRLAPFDDPPDQALVLNRSVGEKRAEILNRLGLEVVPVNSMEEIRDTEFIVMWDYVYCSQACLKSFLRAVSRHRQSRRLALESNPQIEMSLPMQDLHVLPPVREGGPEIYGFDLFYVCESDFDASRLSQIAPEVVPAKMRVAEVDPPLYVRIKDKNRIGMSPTYCMHLKHWTHIYLLNYAALTGLPFEWGLRRLPWLLWRILTGFTLNRHKLAARLVIKGKRCSIHPTAEQTR